MAEPSSSVVADCHVHTTRSDGQLSVADIPAAANRAGLEVVAVTDHDRIHPDFNGSVRTESGVTIVHGIELRVAGPAQRVDLLGYGVDPTPDLQQLCNRLAAERRERGRAIIDCVEDRLGIDLDCEPFEGIGRPHIARAIADHQATDYTVDGAFGDLIGHDCPCYRARDVPTADRGREVLDEACTIVGLAHPLRYPDPDAAIELATELDAIEVAYPYDRAPGDGTIKSARVRDAARKHDLLPTGGSDAHGTELGAAGLDQEQTDRFLQALGAHRQRDGQ